MTRETTGALHCPLQLIRTKIPPRGSAGQDTDATDGTVSGTRRPAPSTPDCLGTARFPGHKNRGTRHLRRTRLTSPPAEAGRFNPRGLSFLLRRQQPTRINGKGWCAIHRSYASSTDLTFRQPGGRPTRNLVIAPDGRAEPTRRSRCPTGRSRGATHRQTMDAFPPPAEAGGLHARSSR